MANAKTLASELSAAGFRMVSGGTDTHLMLVDVFAKECAARKPKRLSTALTLRPTRTRFRSTRILR